MKNLAQLFNFYGSDKESNHGYAKYYEKHLPERINIFLEIGTWKGAGILSFQDFYDDKGLFETMNYTFGGEIISVKELNNFGIFCREGYQEDIHFLKTIQTKFTVIVDDGSHHADAQLITFKQMFLNNIEPGGLYVCEDVCGHLPGEEGEYWRRNKVNIAEDTIIPLMKKFLNGEDITSQFFTKQESDIICSLIYKVDIYDDKIIFITKKP